MSDEQTTTFEQAGFLSNETEEFRRQHVSANSELFSLGRDLNLFAHEQVRGCKVNGTELQHLVSICLYFRILNSFAATLILTEMGMCHDAEVIAKDSRFKDLYEELKSYVDEEELREHKAIQVAMDAGLGDLYDFAYRTLSQSVHPTIRSLQRYLEFNENDEAEKLILAPESDSIPLVVATAVSVLLTGTKLIGETFKLTLAEIEKLEDRFSALSKAQKQE